ncbi:ornithine cyclodeaminase family protein [uncultured Albimonas sp.]|uniref:ornithine cyclodeaminase family protein n=1 Tax=uncultured Albimonas sp. TaxID=1331701 RepID=UPI0030EE7C0D|tara:strand:+ start:2888 stop:3847 length:960 start_codon:yes stop_codon:yes gene_type:complete
MSDLLYLTRADVEGLGITAREMTDMLSRLLRGLGSGTSANAPKGTIRRADGRLCMAMLAASEDPPRFATKSLGLSPANAAAGLPSIGALICLHDAATGHPIAVMDGDWITGVRTAALSTLAALHLARSDAQVLSLIGTGVQGACHLALFTQAFPLTTVRIFGRGRANIEKLAAQAHALGLATEERPSPQAAVEGADLVVSSVTPTPELPRFLDPAWLAPGAFVSMVELARAWQVDRLAGRARVFVDDLEQERRMEDPLLACSLIEGDLAGLASGEATGRRDASEITAFAFRGLALGDLALAALCHEKALEAGVGLRLPR